MELASDYDKHSIVTLRQHFVIIIYVRIRYAPYLLNKVRLNSKLLLLLEGTLAEPLPHPIDRSHY